MEPTMYSSRRTTAQAADAPIRLNLAAKDRKGTCEETALKVDILLAEINQGQPFAGVAQGPRELLDRGLEGVLARAGHAVRGIQSVSDGISSAAARGTALAALADHVEATLKSGRFALTLGGDHSLAFGSIEGVLRACPTARILYIDAHADANTPGTSPSGNTHGMPIAAHLGLFAPSELADASCVVGRLAPSQIAFIGLRDVDEGEENFLNKLGITRFTSDDVRSLGAETVLEKALSAIDPNGEHPIFVSFDIDVMDPELVPATGVPVAAGLEMAQMDALTRGVAKTGRLIGADLVEVNPDLAPDEESLGRSVDIAIAAITNLLS
jgi:arginase